MRGTPRIGLILTATPFRQFGLMTVRSPVVAVLATLDSKVEETRFLVGQLESLGLQPEVIDVSLNPHGQSTAGADKLVAMSAATLRAKDSLKRLREKTPVSVIVGIGGGTGYQIIAPALADPQLSMPRVLITTLAVDPRPEASVTGIILIPSVADLAGLNPTVRSILANAGAIIAGLARRADAEGAPAFDTGRSIGITALGVTGRGASEAARLVRQLGFEATVFHANGFGGNAFANLARRGGLLGAIDYTLHELTQHLFDPASTVGADRMTATRGCPRVLLPGGVNFHTRDGRIPQNAGAPGQPGYSHSPAFRHIRLTLKEMRDVARLVARELQESPGSTTVILPLGGFSSEDRPGGAIEWLEGRRVFSDTLRQAKRGRFELIETDGHINDPETARLAVDRLMSDMTCHPPASPG